MNLAENHKKTKCQSILTEKKIAVNVEKPNNTEDKFLIHM